MARERMPGDPGRKPSSEVRETERAVLSGSTSIMLTGLAAVVLVILSFIGVLRFSFAALATISIGLGLLLQGVALTGRHEEIRDRFAATGDPEAAEAVGAGMTTELVSGIIGIVLGILALLGVAPAALISVSVIAFGVALVMGGPLTARLDELNISSAEIEGVELEGDHKVVRTASGLEVLVGIAAIVLGILALLGIGSPIMLGLAALIVTAASLVFSGGVVAKRSAPLAE